MRLRDQVALTLPSLFLRLALGITFLWAGTGKLIGTAIVTGDDAARLANIGVMPTPLTPLPNITEPGSNTPDEQLPEPITAPPTQPAAQPTTQPQSVPPAEPAADQPAEPPAEPPTQGDKAALQSVQYAKSVYAAADFPEPMEIKRVYTIALMLSKAGDPGLTADSNPILPTIPTTLASKPWPKILAWAAAITELVAGALLILGLFTRISALGILAVMGTAMWMTQFGPAVLHTNNALLGFIPRVADPWSPTAYAELLWQMALAALALGVFFLGSGPIGIDRVLFRPSRRDPYLHGDPKASKTPKDAKAQAPTPKRNRDEFDRTPNPTP